MHKTHIFLHELYEHAKERRGSFVHIEQSYWIVFILCKLKSFYKINIIFVSKKIIEKN